MKGFKVTIDGLNKLTSYRHLSSKLYIALRRAESGMVLEGGADPTRMRTAETSRVRYRDVPSRIVPNSLECYLLLALFILRQRQIWLGYK